jgi:hypothetical protein
MLVQTHVRTGCRHHSLPLTIVIEFHGNGKTVFLYVLDQRYLCNIEKWRAEMVDVDFGIVAEEFNIVRSKDFSPSYWAMSSLPIMHYRHRPVASNALGFED